MSGWSPVVHDGQGKRTDITREKIVRAAAHQFARRPYHRVSVDDIVAEAQVTKSAMYFHFRSKDELAAAVIEARTAAGTIAIKNLFAQGLSGLETLLDFCLLIAVEDTSQDLARAALNLLEVIERPEGLQAKIFGTWINTVAAIVRRAVADGDLQQRCDPQDVAHLIVAIYLGLQQSSNLDEPERFLGDFEKSWAIILRGIVQSDRYDYFQQFMRRRIALAIGAVCIDPKAPRETLLSPPHERTPRRGLNLRAVDELSGPFEAG